MKFRILGELELDGEVVGAGRDRVVLAVLLLQANRTVGVSTLIEAVWGDDPPATVRTQVQVSISRLRRALGPATISTTSAGYRLELEPETLDAGEWTRLLQSARNSPTPEQRAALLRQALDLWRGPALCGTDSAVVRRMAVVLDEQYASAVEEWAGVEVSRGGGPDLVALLIPVVAAHPLRERLRVLLVTALHQAGRQAEALAEFRAARTVLREELGIEPGPELQDLHRQVLSGEPVTRQAGGSPVRALPRAVRDFTGRSDVIDAVVGDLDAEPGGPLVRCIDGMPGVGKTSLALHLAGVVGHRFPDAHLFLDLHGHSDRAAIDVGSAALALLRQLDVAPQRIPPHAEDRAALWRSELARRRALLVLDNAASSAQVMPLLPGTGTSLTVITSRRRLTGLDDVRATSLPVLTPGEAADVFAGIVGERARADPRAVAEVVQLCGALPLAVRLAASRLAARPDWHLADLTGALRGGVLPQLAAEERAVAAAFSTSYLALSAPLRRLFRLLGVYPGQRIDAPAAAALADISVEDACRALDELHGVHLLEATTDGAYRLHDLIREYAAARAGEDPDEYRAAAARLFDHAVHRAATVARELESPVTQRNRRFGAPLRPDLLPDPGTDPASWFDRYGRDQMDLLLLAEALGDHPFVWKLARATWRLWYLHAQFDDVVDAHQRGLLAARATGDDTAAVLMANYLASGLHRLGRTREAARVLSEAQKTPTEKRFAIDSMLRANLAYVRLERGEANAAAEAALGALEAARQFSDPGPHAQALNAMALARAAQGRHGESLGWHRREMLAAVSTGNMLLRSSAINNVAVARMQLGHRPAERLLTLAIALTRRLGNRTGRVEMTSALAVLHRRGGDLDRAIAVHRAALETAGDLAYPRLQAVVRNDFAETMLAAADLAAAEHLFRQAYRSVEQADVFDEAARSLEGIGITAGDPRVRRDHLTRALTLYRRIDADVSVRRVEHRLAAVSSPAGEDPSLAAGPCSRS